LFANRQVPRRTETPEGLEATFVLYYLSRYLLATSSPRPWANYAAEHGGTVPYVLYHPGFTR
jgi:hypothetical protein